MTCGSTLYDASTYAGVPQKTAFKSDLDLPNKWLIYGMPTRAQSLKILLPERKAIAAQRLSTMSSGEDTLFPPARRFC